MVKGNCFEVAGKIIADSLLGFDLGGLDNPVLVHGVVVGQGGDVEGKRYVHGWVEDGNEVIDRSNGRDIRISKVAYYAIGNIDKKEVIKYTREQARKLMLKTDTYGPWKEFKNVVG